MSSSLAPCLRCLTLDNRSMALLWSPALLPLISTRRIHNNNNQQVDRDDDREAALKQFFSPRSVAVVGASNAPSKVGHAVVSNLVEHGFAGQIYPVNPRAKADTLISGRRAYPSLAAVPGAVELAVIAVPARAVAGVLEDAGEKGVKGAIVISSGFREASAAGVQVEQQLLAIAAKHGIRLLGPNCLGVIDTDSKLQASFAAGMPRRGGVAFMSQSGALCTSVLDTAAAAAVGFSRFVSLGNKLDVNESDLLAAWEHDPHVRVIAAYLEGIVDGKRFMRVASRVTKAKPVVMIKSGTTAAGIKAVSSHTGTLAGADHAYDAVLRQSGVLRVETVQDMFDVMTAFEHQPLPPAGDPGVCVITNAGGPGIMASDALERAGLTLAALSPATQEKLRRGLPPSASAANPVDVLGDAGADRYAHALDCVMEDPCVGAVLVVLTPQMMTRPKETAAAVAAAAARSGKTMLGVLMGDEAVAEGEHILHINGVPNYPVPERAVKALAAMARQRRWQDRPAAAPKRFSSVDAAAVADVFRRVRADGRSVAGDAESVAIKAAYGIPSPETANAANANEAVAAADRMGYPVVLKVSSPDILHKTDVGGVALGLGSAQAVREAFESIVAKAQKALEPVPGGGRIWGCMVQKQAPKGAKELLLGVKRDAQFGHLVVFGLGGIYVEALKDVTFRVAPVDRAQAYEMLDEIRAAPLLRGVRSEPPVDREAVVDAILRLSQLVVDFPEIIEEADINPLLAFDKGAQAIDMRVILGPATADGGSAAKKRSL